MATIAKNNLNDVTVNTITRTQLDGTDTLGSKSGILFVQNETGGTINLVIDGDEAPTNLVCAGAGEINLSSGYTVSVAAGETKRVNLGKISEYLKGTVSIAGGAASVYAWIE